MRRILRKAALVVVLAGISALMLVLAGAVPIAASAGHWRITAALLSFTMRRAVSARALGIDAPDLDSPRLVLMGAGHYEGGCRPCHGAPGTRMPRIPAAMTPAPPRLAEHTREYSDEELFYIVKHGIKFTGMPAWPAQQRDDEVWAVVASLRVISGLSEAEYAGLVGAPERPAPALPSVAAEDVEHLVRESCARCHGVDGLSHRRGAFPYLAGQRSDYLRSTLAAYASGRRHSGIMQPVAADLSDRQMSALARWYSTRPSPEPSMEAPPPGGREIAQLGIPERRIPSCEDCHDKGTERRDYPLLAAQQPAYLKQQLRLFAQGARGGTEYANLMRATNPHDLKPEEVRAVARYYAAMPRAGEASPP